MLNEINHIIVIGSHASNKRNMLNEGKLAEQMQDSCCGFYEAASIKQEETETL